MTRALKVTLSIFVIFLFVFIHPYSTEWLCFGGRLAEWGQTIGLFGILISGAIFSVFLVNQVLSKIIKRIVIRLISTGILGIFFWVILIVAAAKINKYALSAAVWRAVASGNFIVSSINEYKIKNGSYPISLNDLNITIPKTNICAFQNFTYIKSNDEADDLSEMMKKTKKNETLSINDAGSATGGYELTVEMPQGVLNWDVLVYWPSEKYPSHLKGGDAERFDNWIYVHE